MNRIAALIAVVVALAGMAMLWLYMERYEEQVRGGTPVPVVVALRDIPLGTTITEDMLAQRAIPQAYVERRHVRADEVERMVGVRVRTAIRANEAVLWTDLATTTEHSRDLSSLIRSGNRAMTLRAEQMDIEGLIQPGDRVDVMLTTHKEGAEAVTITLLQNLLVLAVGQNTGGAGRVEGERRSYGNRSSQVTLSVTPEQAQTLALALEKGRLSLVMRNPDDIAVLEGLPETTSEDIIEVERRTRIQRRRPGCARRQSRRHSSSRGPGCRSCCGRRSR